MASPRASSPGMGKLFKVDLSGPRIYSCAKCRCHLAKSEDIISKSFTGRHGRAYLFNSVVNVAVGKHEERMLLTGMHTVADVVCIVCDEVVGWKYLEAYEEAQKYKQGKFILEKQRMDKEPGWT